MVTVKINFGMMWVYRCSVIMYLVAIIILLAILQNLKDGQLSRPFTCIAPVQFLDGYHNRWSCAATFGATTSTIVALFYGNISGFFDVDASTWATPILILLCILEACINYYPLFACLATPHKVVGSVIGFIYSATWFVVQAVYLFECPHIDAKMRSAFSLDMAYEGVLVQWPALACLLFLMGKFVLNLWSAWQGGYFVLWKQMRLAEDHQLTYVRRLLKGDIKDRFPIHGDGIVARYRYRSIPGFLFPTRVVVAVAVSLFILYQIGVAYVYLGAKLFVSTRESIHSIQTVTLLVTTVAGFVTIAEVLWYILTAVVLLSTCTYFYLILRKYKLHFLKLCRGDQSFLPSKQLQAYEIMADSMRWGGYQVAYMVWSFLISHIVAYFFLMLLVIMFYFPIALDRGDIILNIFLTLGIPLLMNIVVYYGQSVWARLMLLQPPVKATDSSSPLAINNRRAYENVSYYTFIANITIGLASSLSRLIKSLVLGVLMLGRLDRAFLMSGFEYWDRGFQAYVGMLMVDYTHNHPVLRVFAQLIWKRNEFQGSLYQSPRHSICRARWHLLYTLINNPTLITKRKHYVNEQQGKRVAAGSTCLPETCVPDDIQIDLHEYASVTPSESSNRI